MEDQKILSIVLTDNISFEDITNKIAFAFNIKLQTVNDDVAKYFNRAYETQIYKEMLQDKNQSTTLV